MLNRKKVSMIENLRGYIQNVAFDNYNELSEELNKRQFIKPKGRPPYSIDMIRWLHPNGRWDAFRKTAQYHGGEYVKAGDEGNLYKGIVPFMIAVVDMLHCASYSWN